MCTVNIQVKLVYTGKMFSQTTVSRIIRFQRTRAEIVQFKLFLLLFFYVRSKMTTCKNTQAFKNKNMKGGYAFGII